MTPTLLLHFVEHLVLQFEAEVSKWDLIEARLDDQLEL
jgi:hypothetical protein